MHGLKALLFDKDGTLVDFDRTWGPAAGAVMRTLAEGDGAALVRLEEISAYVPDEARFLPTSPLVSGSSAHYGPMWAEALGQPADSAFLARIDHLFRIEGMRSLTPIGAPANILARLQAAGYLQAIVTNDAEANAREQMEALGLLPYLSAIHGYDSGFGSKPGAGMVQALVTRHALDPGSVAVIGDSAHDLAAARGAGTRFILVTSGPAPVDDLFAQADLVLDSIADLPDHLIAG
ncbi:MAG: hydrolase [Rhizobiales bacterium 32-66-8]|nr:MAG: hydrolase [Rhizobiales bacterium 32-66-8]